MADLPITSNDGAMPIVINDPVTTANVAHVTAANELLVTGTKTNNNAAPTATLLSSANYLANAVAPSWTEGNLVLGSVDLAGNTRVIGTKTNNSAAPTTQVGVIPAIANAVHPTWTEGDQVLLSETLTGALRVEIAPQSKAIFTTMSTVSTPTLPTDIIYISGSATKTVRILSYRIAIQRTTPAMTEVVVLRRSTANTEGAGQAAVAIQHDTNDAAATAVVWVGTGNPLMGTLVANLDTIQILGTAATTTTVSTAIYENCYTADGFDKGIVLRGLAQVLAFNLNGITIAGGVLYVQLTWAEE